MEQQNNQSPSLPLWKKLNEEREQGLVENKDKIIRTHPNKMFFAQFMGEKSHANAEFTALAVNNLASLAELLEDVLETIEQSDAWWMSSPDRGGFDVEKIKEALNKIS